MSSQISWSFSRYNQFQRCQRAYFYQYVYSSLVSRDPKVLDDVDQDAFDQLPVLAALTDSRMLLGSLIHEAAADALQHLLRAETPPDQDIAQTTLDRGVRVIEASKDGTYLQFSEEFVGLREHHYSEAFDKAQFVAELSKLLANLFRHRAYMRLCESPYMLRGVEQLRQFKIDDVNVYAKLDASLVADDGTQVVLDWKLSPPFRTHELLMQLTIYSMSLDRQDYAGVSETVGVAAIIRNGESLRHEIEELQVERTRTAIKQSVERMRSAVDDLSAKGLAQAFPKRPKGSKACRSCAFRALCKRDYYGYEK